MTTSYVCLSSCKLQLHDRIMCQLLMIFPLWIKLHLNLWIEIKCCSNELLLKQNATQMHWTKLPLTETLVQSTHSLPNFAHSRTNTYTNTNCYCNTTNSYTNTKCCLLTDKTRIHLRSASIRTYTFFTTGFPRFLSIRGARGLLALNQVLI
jgi:hypothetical protein